MDSEIIAAFIGPVFTAMLAGAGILIKSIQIRHREQSARARDLEVATRTVDFINTYLQAQEKLHSEAEREFFRERAKRDLEVAYQTMMATANADFRAESGTTWIGVVKRALLGGLKRPAAKVVRVFFFIFCVINVLLMGTWTTYSFSDPEMQKDVPVLIFVMLFGVVLFLLPIVLLYLWARWLDRDRTPKPPPVPSAGDPVLGHYGYWQPPPEQTMTQPPYGQPTPPGYPPR